MLLDLTVVLVAYVAVSVALLVATASLDEAARTAVSIATFLLVLVGGPIAVETLSHGRSLGKAACGLRVVRDDGGRSGSGTRWCGVRSGWWRFC